MSVYVDSYGDWIYIFLLNSNCVNIRQCRIESIVSFLGFPNKFLQKKSSLCLAFEISFYSLSFQRYQSKVTHFQPTVQNCSSHQIIMHKNISFSHFCFRFFFFHSQCKSFPKPNEILLFVWRNFLRLKWFQRQHLMVLLKIPFNLL